MSQNREQTPKTCILRACGSLANSADPQSQNHARMPLIAQQIIVNGWAVSNYCCFSWWSIKSVLADIPSLFFKYFFYQYHYNENLETLCSERSTFQISDTVLISLSTYFYIFWWKKNWKKKLFLSPHRFYL